MDRTTEILRIKMDGRWTARDLGSFATALSELYDLRLVLELMREEEMEWRHFYEEFIHFPPFKSRFRKRLLRGQPLYFPFQPTQIDITKIENLGAFIDSSERLECRKLEYASPGASDLAGIGAIIGHVKDFIVKLLDRHDQRAQREVDVEGKKLQNAREFVALARDLGYSDLEIRSLATRVADNGDVIQKLADAKKITDVSIVDSNSDESN